MNPDIDADLALAMALAEAEPDDEDDDDFQYPLRSSTFSQMAILKEHNGSLPKGKSASRRQHKVSKRGNRKRHQIPVGKENENGSNNCLIRDRLREEKPARLGFRCSNIIDSDAGNKVALTQFSLQGNIQEHRLMPAHPAAFHTEEEEEVKINHTIPNNAAENADVRGERLKEYDGQIMSDVAPKLENSSIETNLFPGKLEGDDGREAPDLPITVDTRKKEMNFVADILCSQIARDDNLDRHDGQAAPDFSISTDMMKTFADVVVHVPCSQVVRDDGSDIQKQQNAFDLFSSSKIIRNETDLVVDIPCSHMICGDKMDGDDQHDAPNLAISLDIMKNVTDLVRCSQIVREDKLISHEIADAPHLAASFNIIRNEMDFATDNTCLHHVGDDNEKQNWQCSPGLSTIISITRKETNLVAEIPCSQKDALSTDDFCQVDEHSRKDVPALAIANLGIIKMDLSADILYSQKDVSATNDSDFGSQLGALLNLCSNNMVEEKLSVEHEFMVDIKLSVNNIMDENSITNLLPEIEDEDVMGLMTQVTDVYNNKESSLNFNGDQLSPTEWNTVMLMVQSSKIASEDIVAKEADSEINLEMDIPELRTDHVCCQKTDDNAACASINIKDYHESQASDSIVQCPVCGIHIMEMSHEQRELHTNKCLDDLDQHKENDAVSTDPNEEGKDASSIHISPVLKWLEDLGLSKYATIFMKEEIDWDTLKWLTEEDLNALGITTLGPRRKIAQALQVLKRDPSSAVDAVSRHHEEQANSSNYAASSGKKLITDFFLIPQGISRPTNANSSMNSCPDPAPAPVKKAGHNAARNKKRSSTQRSDVPKWMTIPGSKFRVDAFQYLRGDCVHWFLTHFHTDHYQGLTRGFRYGNIYCSSITAQLVHIRIGVAWEHLRPLPLNERVNIDGCHVTFIDANHCPGSVMILFEFPGGQAVLHTGDFRFCEEMTTSPVLQACNVHTLVLDTTYCNPQYDFPKQDIVIQFIIDAIQAEAFNPSTLFLIGTYTIGKERIFLEVARVLQKKFYVGTAKLHLLECMNFKEEEMKWLTVNEHESHIHVVPLWTIASFKRMKFISQHYKGKYNSIIAFSPTGWSYGRGKKRTPGRRWQQGTIIRYEVPYSEHSSFKELQEFVRFLSPNTIIPSVHNDNPEAVDAMVALLLDERQDSGG